MKVSKDEAGYTDGKRRHHCGPWDKDDTYYCRFFNPGPRLGTCDKVEGKIEAHAGCDLYVRQGK